MSTEFIEKVNSKKIKNVIYGIPIIGAVICAFLFKFYSKLDQELNIYSISFLGFAILFMFAVSFYTVVGMEKSSNRLIVK